MKGRLSLALAATALAVAVLGITQLGQAAPAGSSKPLAALSTASGDVFFDPFKDVMPLTGSPAAPTLVAETSVLDQGSYLMVAKVVAAGRTGSFARAECQLRYPGWSGSIATTDNSGATVGVKLGAAEDQTISLLWAATFISSGRVRLVCWPEEQHGIAPVVSDGSLAVLPVSSIGS